MTLHRYGRNGDWEKAVALLEEMQTDGVRPDAVTYGTIVAAVSGRRTPCAGTPPGQTSSRCYDMQSSCFLSTFPLFSVL